MKNKYSVSVIRRTENTMLVIGEVAIKDDSDDAILEVGEAVIDMIRAEEKKQ